MKHLVMKTPTHGNLDDEAFDRALLEWRNTPNSQGLSPAQIVFGHPARSVVPTHRRAFAHCWRQAAASANKEAAAQRLYNETAHPLPPSSVGAKVLIQDPRSRRWTSVGTVVEVGRRRDYQVRLPSGRVLWRNRRFLRPHMEAQVERSSGSLTRQAEGVVEDNEPSGESAPAVPNLRRSSRLPRAPPRMDL